MVWNKSWSLVLLALAATVGCGKSSTTVVEQLPGSWQGEFQVHEDALNKFTPEQVETLREMRMELDFHPDGKLILKGENKGQPYTSEARWELVDVQGDTVRIKTTEAKTTDDGPQEKLIDFHFYGKDDFVMPVKNERADLGSMRFKRLR